MVIPELLAAVAELDEDEQHALAASLSRVPADDEMRVTPQQRKLVEARYDELRADPGLGVDRGTASGLMRELLSE